TFPFGLHQYQVGSDVVKDVVILTLFKLSPRISHLKAVHALVVEEARFGEFFAISADVNVISYCFPSRDGRNHEDKKQRRIDISGNELHPRNITRVGGDLNRWLIDKIPASLSANSCDAIIASASKSIGPHVSCLWFEFICTPPTAAGRL